MITARTTMGLCELEAYIDPEDDTLAHVTVRGDDPEPYVRSFVANWDGEEITNPDLRIPESEEPHWEQAFERLSEQLSALVSAIDHQLTDHEAAKARGAGR